MTKSSIPDKQPTFNQRLRFLILSRTSISVGVLTLLIGLGFGTWWLWIFVYEQLAPLVEKNLTQTLNRPVQLGRVTQFSLTGLRFGASSVPATPNDPDRVSVDTVDVAFNLLQLVFTRTLELDVTLVNPDVYVEQNEKGEWISNTLAAQDSSGLIKTDLKTIRFRNANVVLVPKRGRDKETLHAPPVAIAKVNGATEFLEGNQTIRFEVRGQMGNGGTIAIQGSRLTIQQTNLQIQGQNLLASDITRLVELPLELQSGRANGNLNIQIRPEQQLSIFGTAELNAVTAQIKQLPQPFINSQGKLRFKDKQVTLDNIQTSYGKIPLIANGAIDTETGYNILGRVKSVSIANAQQTLGIKLPVSVTGEARATAQLTGPILKPILSGTVATIKPAHINFVGPGFTDMPIGNTNRSNPPLLTNIRTRFAFSTAASEITFKDIQATPTVGGRITGGGKIQLGQKVGLGFDVVARLPGDAIARIYSASPPIQIGTVEAKAKISGTPANPKTVINWQARSATYPAQGEIVIASTNTLFRNTIINMAGGTVRASGRLADGRWQASAQADSVQLERAVDVPPQLQGRLTGTFNLSGTASLQPEIRVNGKGRITGIAGGIVTASNIQLQRGKWQAMVSASRIQLARFSEQLRGQLSGQLRLTGTLDSFTPAAIRATGDVRFSQGIGLIQQPLTAMVSWDGEKVIVQRATAPNVTASGLIFARVSGVGAPEVTGLNLNVQAQNYNLQDLPLTLPNAVELIGRGDFSGRVTGTLPTPNVVGSLRLRKLVVNNLAFEPLLTGNFQLAAGRGVKLEVSGSQDQITLNLNSNYRPTSFLVRRAGAVATGQTQGENLLVNVNNFPLTALNLTPPTAAFGGPIAGLLTGDFEIDPETYAVAGNVAIAQPASGRIRFDSFVGQFRYANGVGTLTNGEFTLDKSRYALAGSFTYPTGGSKSPRFEGQVNITQGQVQDVLTALAFFELQDFGRGLQPPTYARAADLNTVSVGIPEASLLTQLRRFSEIEALLQQKRRDASPVPSLADLQGTFGGKISLSGSLQTGVEVNFELEGKNWEWGSYTAEQVIAQGSFEDGVLTLLPLRIESNETLLAFNGQVGGTQQSGQLRVRNFPVKELNKFVTLPVVLTGQLNATATLAGSPQNPQALGELRLSEGSLNQKPIESALGSFSYANARFNFNTQVMSGPDPIQITGSGPVQLPFAKVPPASNEISLNVNVQNEGLALLNVLTNSFAWESGQGQVQLQVRGTREQPVATGIATVNNATIIAQALPEPLTNITGTVRFTGNRIQVEGIQGKFSRGNVQARGIIPIFQNLEPGDPDFTNPLTVTLDRLALNLQGLYQGEANGNVEITGSALSPIIGGKVRLAQGQVSLPESEAVALSTEQESQLRAGVPPLSQTGVERRSTVSSLAPSVGNVDDVTVPEFNNLQLTLGDNIEIARPPILNFQATGTITLNGNRNDIRPDGTIRLRRGGINLFTTQFVLARGNENIAIFTPNQGLDPNLDIELISRVPEVTQRRVPNSPLSAEINQPLSTELGALQTVRVQARIAGLASQLFDNLELTSNPSRSETEIIALLGGGFVNTLGRGDTTLGFANLATSALLGNFQGTVNNIGYVFGLSELRLFPTVITSERSRTSSSTLGLAAEAGIDISRNLSISVLRVLTADQPTQFGLSYRLNNQVRLRTSTDFSNESRAVVEYENQF